MYLSIPVWCKCSYGVAMLLLVGGAIGVGLIVIAGMELMELSQACGFHMFDVFDTVPCIPFQPLQ
jgi:hypothetical protein